MSEKDRERYEAWGVVVRTSDVRGAHIANGLVQLLRLLPDAPHWRDDAGAIIDRADYIKRVQESLTERFDKEWQLSGPARALCVTGCKAGDIDLHNPPNLERLPKGVKLVRDAAALAHEGKNHLDGVLAGGAASLSPGGRLALAEVLNADNKVKVVQASDPSTPGFVLAGYTRPHTLQLMHAATFLGLLGATDHGANCLVALHDLCGRNNDPHSALARLLGIAVEREVKVVAVEQARNAFPVPNGPWWDDWAEIAGDATSCLLAWSGAGVSKADTFMSIVDLATLLLSMQLLRWRGGTSHRDGDRLLLVVSRVDQASRTRTLVQRAQLSLKGMEAALNAASESHKLTLENTKEGDGYQRKIKYPPGLHALNLAASGGWLFPRHARGGARRWFCPGARQLTTLVRALVKPDETLTWEEFAERAERVGLALGGLHEHSTAKRLHFAGGASTVRAAGVVNRASLVALGLAKRESDDVVRIDGGER